MLIKRSTFNAFITLGKRIIFQSEIEFIIIVITYLWGKNNLHNSMPLHITWTLDLPGLV